MPAAWGDYQAGERAYLSGDYKKALEIFRPLAEQGHEGAQALLGMMYENGWGVREDKAEAAKWYRKALETLPTLAEQGDASAQYHLGGMYGNGTGVARDDSIAVFWYRKAAEQGDANAQNNLGF